MRNPFKRAPKAVADPPEPSVPARLAQIELQLSALAGAQAQLQLGWQETLDKITAWANRAAARDRRALERALDAPRNGDQVELDVPVTTAAERAAEAKAQLRRQVFSNHR